LLRSIIFGVFSEKKIDSSGLRTLGQDYLFGLFEQFPLTVKAGLKYAYQFTSARAVQQHFPDQIRFSALEK